MGRAQAKKQQPGAWPVFWMYAAYALVFVIVAVYTFVHLVFYGFSGEPIGVDLLLGLVLPLTWILGLLFAIGNRKRRLTSLRVGWSFLIVLVIILIGDSVRFAPLFAS
jgi:hypothetical protein